jgi:1-acyl-sn-glycerol-3-phosphate acyltransferase
VSDGQQPPEPPPPPRLVAANDTDRLRVGVGGLALLRGASVGFACLTHVGTSDRIIHRAERAWARATARTLRLRLDIEGMDLVDPTQTYVITALHEGLVDIVALFHMPLAMRFLVRDELFSWTTLGRYLRATNQIEVSESRELASLRRLYAESKAAISAGESLVVFPQGSVLGIEVGFQEGAFRLARSLGARVLPVVLAGSHRVWEHPFSPLVRLDQRVFMRVLPAIDTHHLTPTASRHLERRMKKIALEESSVTPRRFDPDRDGWWDGYRFEIDPDFPELASRLARRRAGSC